MATAGVLDQFNLMRSKVTKLATGLTLCSAIIGCELKNTCSFYSLVTCLDIHPPLKYLMEKPLLGSNTGFLDSHEVSCMYFPAATLRVVGEVTSSHAHLARQRAATERF